MRRLSHIHTLTGLLLSFPSAIPSFALYSFTWNIPHPASSIPRLLCPGHTIHSISRTWGLICSGSGAPLDWRSEGRHVVPNQLRASLQQLPQEVVHYLGPTWHLLFHWDYLSPSLTLSLLPFFSFSPENKPALPSVYATIQCTERTEKCLRHQETWKI